MNANDCGVLTLLACAFTAFDKARKFKDAKFADHARSQITLALLDTKQHLELD